MTTDWRDWLLFAIIMAACCLGCTPPDDIGAACSTGVVDISQPAVDTTAPVGIWVAGLPERETVDACRMWSWTGLTCETAASYETAWLVVVGEDNPDCTPDDAGIVQLGSAGWRRASIHFSCYKGQVGIDPGISGAYTATVAHEIGHALGLDHVEDPAALMHYRLQYQRALNDTDRAEFTRVWGDLSPP